MIAGAAGALLCVAAGLSLGMAVRERWMSRYRMLQQTREILTRMRLRLQEERLGLCELLEACAAGRKDGISQRFCSVARQLRTEPLTNLADAYRLAEAQLHISGEMAQEKAALRQFFGDLAVGTAAMREQAAAACLRRLKPVEEEAQRRAQTGSRLCVQLGMLAGLMAGIMLW